MTDGMKRVVKEIKIVCKTTLPYTSNLNGTAGFNRDLQEKINCLIFDSGFPKEMWVYTLNFALVIYNNTPKRSIYTF